MRGRGSAVVCPRRVSILVFLERNPRIPLKTRLALAGEDPEHDADEGNDQDEVINGQVHVVPVAQPNVEEGLRAWAN